MKIRKTSLLAAMAIAFGLSACGDTAGETVSDVTTETTIATTATTAATTAAVTTTTSETTTEPAVTTTAETTAAAPVSSVFSEPDPEKFRVYEVELTSGYPEICDIETIKARQKNDVENFYNFDLDTLKIVPVYENGTYKYIEEDMDYDGKSEYFLIVENELDFSNVDSSRLETLYVDSAAGVSVYYIEDTGEVSFVHFMNNVSARQATYTKDDVTFNIGHHPQKFYMVDYGGCKHLIRWYWPAYDGVGGNGFQTLYDRNRFFEMDAGGVNVDISNENKVLAAEMYTYLDEYVWNGSDYTLYPYETEYWDSDIQKTVVHDDYHDFPREGEEPKKMTWYYGE